MSFKKSDSIALFLVPESLNVYAGDRVSFAAYIRNLTDSVLEEVKLYIYSDDSLIVDLALCEPCLSETDSFTGGISVGLIRRGETRIFNFTARAFSLDRERTATSRIHIKFKVNDTYDYRVSPRSVVVIKQAVDAEPDNTQPASNERLIPITYTGWFSDIFLIEGLKQIEDILLYTKNAYKTAYGLILNIVITIKYIDFDNTPQTTVKCRCTLIQVSTSEFTSPRIVYGQYEVAKNGNRILLDVPITLTQE